MPVSGSANPNEPPAPGVPNALSEDPKTHKGAGLAKPRENDVSTCNTLSRSPFVGGIAGFFSASRVLGVKPISEPPVAALPYSLAIDRASHRDGRSLLCAIGLPVPEETRFSANYEQQTVG